MRFELEAHADGHGRVHQQARGQQFNVERAYFGDRATLPSDIFNLSHWPLVRESDPLELRVHRSAVSSGNAVPPYVARDADTELEEALTRSSIRGGLVLLVGDSTAGKSRSAYQAILRKVPNYRLVAPDSQGELRASLAQIVGSPERVVLWLDDIERFLGMEGLTPRVTTYLRRAGILSLGTIRTEHYRILKKLSDAHPGTVIAHDELIAAESVLNQADLVFMPRQWTSDERARAAMESDPRIADALQHADTYGIAEYLAAGPRLLDEWNMAWSAKQNPRGAAIVAAVIDCHRAGLSDSVPVSLIRAVHEHYLNKGGGILLEPESFREAMDWATKRRYGITSLVSPTKQAGRFKAFDYLTDRVMQSADKHPIPPETWAAVRREVANDDHLVSEVAFSAVSQGNRELAKELWTELVERGSGLAACNLAFLQLRTGDANDGERLLKLSYDMGYLRAATDLGHLLEGHSRQDEAEEWYERAAEGNDPHGLYHLAYIYRKRGMEHEAESCLREAMSRKEMAASTALGELLVTSGRLEEAEAILRAAGAQGDVASLSYLGLVLAGLDRVDEAERLWLEAAERDSGEAKVNLAITYAGQKRNAEAEKWYRKAVDDNVDEAVQPFGSFLASQRRWREAEVYLRQAARTEDAVAYHDLAGVLWETNRLDEALVWLKKAVDLGLERAIANYAQALVQSNRSADAVPFWRQLVDRGDSDATFALAKINLEDGNVEEAKLLFQSAAESGDSHAACELARIYDSGDDSLRADEWFEISLAGGHGHAACILGTKYLHLGDYSRAEKYWRQAYNLHHEHVAQYLATLMAQQGRGQEAALWLRRARGGPASSRKERRPKQKGRKPGQRGK